MGICSQVISKQNCLYSDISTEFGKDVDNNNYNKPDADIGPSQFCPDPYLDQDSGSALFYQTYCLYSDKTTIFGTDVNTAHI